MSRTHFVLGRARFHPEPSCRPVESSNASSTLKSGGVCHWSASSHASALRTPVLFARQCSSHACASSHASALRFYGQFEWFAHHWRKPGHFRFFRGLKVCATLVRDAGRTVAAASNRRSRVTTMHDHNGICATMDEPNWNFEKLKCCVNTKIVGAIQRVQRFMV